VAAAGVFLASFAPGRVALAEGMGSTLIGSVADVQGAPVAGALISLFGQGIKGGALVAFSDQSGRFVLSALPAGSYTLRAIERSHVPSPARSVTILPNQDTLYSLVLARVIGQISDFEAAERERQLDWLLRHKRRSVLEDRDPAAQSSDTSVATPVALAGAVELMTSPGTFGSADNSGMTGTPANWSVIRLRGRIPGTGEWAVSGLVSDAEGTNWRMAGELNWQRWDGHSIRIGTGYGTWVPRNFVLGNNAGFGAGAAFVEDQWRVSDSVTTTLGARYSYIGFVSDRNQVDPRASVVFQGRDGTRYEASVARMTVTPGGDLVAISNQGPSAALSLAVTDPALRPERVLRCRVGADRAFGATSVGVHLLAEETSEQLLNNFDRPDSAVAISNGRDLSARGVAFSVGRQLGRVVGASVVYTYGQASHSEVGMDQGLFMNIRDAEFQDLAARFEAVLSSSDTHFAAFYRINTMRGRPEALGPQSSTNSRFDIQLRQGLPLLGSLTRADWELLVAIRNLFYAADEAGVLDEFAVLNPPIRVVGGISVRF
jgi:hypothetical protein